MRTMRGGPAIGAGLVLLLMLRVALRLARHGSRGGGLTVVVVLVLLGAVVVLAIAQNRGPRR
jgi:hypothetical protein